MKFNFLPFFLNNKKCFVYYANVSDLNVEKNVDGLPKIRKEKADRLMFINDKKQSIGVYLLLKKALKKHRIDINDYEFKYTENGKPYLENCPFNVSLSHSNEYVLVGISKNEIGVDIQEVSDIDENALDYLFSEKDWDFYSKSKRKTDVFYKIWTLKEAFVKMTGEGITKKLSSIQIDEEYLNNQVYFMENNDIENYKIGIASKSKNIKIKKLDL